jgi:hypothetical protein
VISTVSRLYRPDACAPQKLYPAENEPDLPDPGSRSAITGSVAEREKDSQHQEQSPERHPSSLHRDGRAQQTGLPEIRLGTLPRSGRTQPFWNTQLSS